MAPTEKALLATGAADLPHLAARTLEQAVWALERDQSERAIAAVMDLADLLDVQGLHIPFDVQTAFYRIWTASGALGAQGAAQLAPVAWRLGFAGAGGD